VKDIVKGVLVFGVCGFILTQDRVLSGLVNINWGSLIERIREWV
jgi:hypothetical protein